MNNEHLLNETTARALWKSHFPEFETALHAQNRDNRFQAANHFSGFKAALKLTGHMEMR